MTMTPPWANKSKKNLTHSQVGLCSGFGQLHSTEAKRNPKAYVSVTLEDINRMAKSPTADAKADGQWCIPSTLASRVFLQQKERGTYYALWADIDENAPTTRALFDLVKGLFDSDFLIYSSRSATVANQKARIIVPLGESVSGFDFIALQLIFNDKLEALGVTPDRVTERPAQLCYLPNKGDFYEHYHQSAGKAFDAAGWAAEMQAEIDKAEQATQRQAQAWEHSQLKAQARVASGVSSAIDAFKAEFAVESMLEKYGYQQKGSRWLSPNSDTKSPGVSVMEGNRWISQHGSDASIGRECPGGGVAGDSFDLFMYYECGNDYATALKAAGDILTVTGGQTLNERNREEYLKSNVTEITPGIADGLLAGFNATQTQQAATPSATDLPVCMVRDLLESPPSKPEELWRGPVMPHGGNLLLAGPPKVGKSMFFLQMAIAAASGSEFLGFEFCRPLRVFWLQAEIMMPYVLDRMRPLLETLTDDQRELVKDNLQVTGRTSISLSDARDLQKVRVVVNDFQPDIIAIDPIANLFTGNENDSVEVRAFLKNVEVLANTCERTATVMALHHTKKTIDLSNPFEAIRGSGAWRGWYDTGFVMAPNEDALALVYECRNGPEPEAHGLKREGVAFQTVALPSPYEKPEKANEADNIKQTRMANIARMVQQKGGAGYPVRQLKDKVEEMFNVKDGQARSLIRDTKNEGLIQYVTQGSCHFYLGNVAADTSAGGHNA